MDSGIDFGQALPWRHLAAAESAAGKSDFSLVIGTSMRVAPASTLPFVLGGADEKCCGGSAIKNVMIVNLMETPFDDQASVRSFAKSDIFFSYLMQELELEVSPPPDVSHLMLTATQMKSAAKKYLPNHGREYVGKAQREREMAEALAKVEAEMLQGAGNNLNH